MCSVYDPSSSLLKLGFAENAPVVPYSRHRDIGANKQLPCVLVLPSHTCRTISHLLTSEFAIPARLCPLSPTRPPCSRTTTPTKGDAPDPEAASSEGDSGTDDDNGASVDGKTGETGAMASLNLDDISSSSEEEQDGDDDDDDDDDQEQDDDEDNRHSKGPTQANVFAGVRDEGAVDAMVEEQIVRLDKQDQKARKGRGAAGQAELKRAREALRYPRDCCVSSASSPSLVLLALLNRSLVFVYICMTKDCTGGNVTYLDCPAIDVCTTLNELLCAKGGNHAGVLK